MGADDMNEGGGGATASMGGGGGKFIFIFIIHTIKGRRRQLGRSRWQETRIKGWWGRIVRVGGIQGKSASLLDGGVGLCCACLVRS
jgi:hypothetical protein